MKEFNDLARQTVLPDIANRMPIDSPKDLELSASLFVEILLSLIGAGASDQGRV